jgi:predicted metal-binding membrane protein
VTALAVRRVAWSHPELAAAGAAAAAWTVLVAHGQYPHGSTEPYLAQVSVWPVMVVAMMVPGALADVRIVALSSIWSRRQRTIALLLGCYVCVWSAFGVVAIGAVEALGLDAGVLLMLAAAWELTAWKWRALRRCHLIEALPPHGAKADAACARAGLHYGSRCVVSCWPLMLAMAAAGHRAVTLMALMTLIVAAEKIVVRSARLRGPAAAALVAAALVALV